MTDGREPATDELAVESRLPGGRTLRHRAVCRRLSRASGADVFARETTIMSAELGVALEGGAPTLLKAGLRWANYGASCWLNLQAIPTSLLAGTNAFAAETGLAAARERLFLFRFPFLLFGRVLRAFAPSFRWSEDAVV